MSPEWFRRSTLPYRFRTNSTPGTSQALHRTGFFSPSLDGGLPLFELFNPSRRSSSAIRAFSDAFSALSAAISAISSSRDGGSERRISRWEHEHVLEAVQERLDANPQAMRQRRETVEHPFGTIKARMGATHFLMKTLPRVASEMALHVLAYNLTRVMNIVGVKPLMAAIQA